VRQHSATHKDWYLLDDLDSGMPGLPRLFTSAYSTQEWQKSWDAKSRSDYSERTGRGIPHYRCQLLSFDFSIVTLLTILINMVDIWTHDRDLQG